MKIDIQETFSIDVEIIAKSMTPTEMLILFSRCANRIAEKGTAEERRDLARNFANAMSENAKRLLADIFSADYIRLVKEGKF